MEVRPSLRGASRWWAALLWDRRPAGTPSSLCQGKAKAEAPPAPQPSWPPHHWVSVVPVQRCSLAGHGAYRSPREFWEVFSSPPPQRGAEESCVSAATAGHSGED